MKYTKDINTINPITGISQNWKKTLFALLILLFLGLLFKNISFSQETKPIFLRRADSLKGITIGNEQIRELIGNVEINQGNVILKCDRAKQFFATNKIEVKGNVILLQDTLRLFAQSGIYNANTRFAETFGSVKINDGHTTLDAKGGTYDAERQLAFFYKEVKIEDTTNITFCDTLRYFRNRKILDANGNVKLFAKDNKTAVFGDSLHYEQLTGYTKIYPRAFLIQSDTTYFSKSDSIKSDLVKIDSLFLKANILEIKKDSGKMIIMAIDSVRLFRDRLSAISKYLTYYRSDSILVFRNNPVLWYEDSQISGDTIIAFIKNKTLSSLYSNTNAFALSKSDSLSKERYNQICGQYIKIVIKDRKIDSIISVNQAMAVYFILDEEKPNGLNKSSGDKLLMMFENGKVTGVKVLSGIEGSYFPDKMVNGKEKEYNLPKFKIILPRPNRNDF